MGKLTKNQKLAAEKIEAGKAYSLKEAASLVKEITFTKFDASLDIDVRLGVDPRKANQMVRGVVSLPHGTGKQVRAIAQDKMVDLNCFTIESAMTMVAGTARSMGIAVKGEFPGNN